MGLRLDSGREELDDRLGLGLSRGGEPMRWRWEEGGKKGPTRPVEWTRTHDLTVTQSWSSKYFLNPGLHISYMDIVLHD